MSPEKRQKKLDANKGLAASKMAQDIGSARVVIVSPPAEVVLKRKPAGKVGRNAAKRNAERLGSWGNHAVAARKRTKS